MCEKRKLDKEREREKEKRKKREREGSDANPLNPSRQHSPREIRIYERPKIRRPLDAERDEARRGETKCGKETHSRDNSRVNLPRVTVARAPTRMRDKCVPVRASISRGLVGDTRARTDRISSRIPARFSPCDGSAEKENERERGEGSVLLSIIIAVPAHV